MKIKNSKTVEKLNYCQKEDRVGLKGEKEREERKMDNR